MIKSPESEFLMCDLHKCFVGKRRKAGLEGGKRLAVLEKLKKQIKAADQKLRWIGLDRLRRERMLRSN